MKRKRRAGSPPALGISENKARLALGTVSRAAVGNDCNYGGRFGGYGLYLLHGKPVFDYNFLDLEHFRWEGGVGAEDWLGSSLKPGKHTIVFDFKYDGPGPAKGGSGVLSVDGNESFDIGSDTRTSVDDSYEVPFHFTGTIDKLTFNLGPSQLTADDQKKAAELLAHAHD
jgi:hypothetical protein